MLFSRFLEDELKSIDLVISENNTQKPVRPLEIKLTTLPDDSTSDLSEDCYGSELVVRSPYYALSGFKHE